MIDIIPRNHHARARVEEFIRQRFAEEHHADIRHFMPYLLRIREDGSGAWRAITGLRPATKGDVPRPLFVEHYLDQPVEREVADATGTTLQRHDIVEIGNLAETSSGGGRHAIIALTGFLTGYGFQWVVFTAITRLANAFSRLGMEPTPLAIADPSKLSPEEQREWGSYYDNNPVVMCGRIRDGFRTLDSLHTPLNGDLRASLLVGYHIGRWWRERRLDDA